MRNRKLCKITSAVLSVCFIVGSLYISIPENLAYADGFDVSIGQGGNETDDFNSDNNRLDTITTDQQKVDEDAKRITRDTIAPLEDGAVNITRSLYFLDEGLYGSKITWTTSDEAHITKSGRVIRPKFDEMNAPVTVDVKLQSGNRVITKSFDFVVLADEKFVDPKHMSDKEFFGEWVSGAWISEPKLDYSYPGLETVGEAAKQGDYELAKERVFEYFKNRSYDIDIGKYDGHFDLLTAEARSDDFYWMQTGYIWGNVMVGDNNGEYKGIIKPTTVVPGATVSYSLRAWYNESSYAKIASTYHSDSRLRPKMELTLKNGETITVDAIDSLMLKAGKYSNVNYGGEEYLHLQTYGDFLGDTTSYAVVKFNFSSLPEGTEIAEARLVLHGTSAPEGIGSKRIIVVKEPSNTWNSSHTLNNFIGYIYSFNGLPGKNTWKKPDGADLEYWWQASRFWDFDQAVAQLYHKQDEEFGYDVIRIVEDFITDTGGYKMSSTQGSEDPNGIRGGFTRSLDATHRTTAFRKQLGIYLKSKYATADFLVALLKTLWDSGNYLTVYNSSGSNWRQDEFNCLLKLGMGMPEYTDSFKWIEMSKEEYEKVFFANNFPDGSYIEGTGAYNYGAYVGFVDYKNRMVNGGNGVSKEYDELLHKSAYYNALMFAPDGSSLQWADESSTKRVDSTFLREAKYYNDEELKYIATYGAEGTEPQWTSRHFPDSAITLMRADWTKDSPYVFTNVRGGGNHAHEDDNNMTVYAYGRILLNDAGIVTYDEKNPDRIWAVSSTAHNTVVINDRTQKMSGDGGRTTGEVHKFVTNKDYDVLSQSTPQNIGFEHRRTITFIKPKMWIVSDLMIPENVEVQNNYKQIWHMLPTANLATSSENKTIYSNYPTDGNIMLASADGSDVDVKEADGIYDRGYGQFEEARYAYFEKNTTGNATFDTVLLPSDNDPTASVKAEKLETRENATALKINYTLEGKNYIGYYFMSYTSGGGNFGKYTTDAETAFISEDENGNIVDVMVDGGTYIKTAEDGKIVYEIGTGTPSVPESGGNVTPSPESGNGGSHSGDKDPVINGGGKPAVKDFNDIADHWAKECISDLQEKGIVKGNGDGIFNPDGDISRAEFTAMIMRALNLPEGEYKGSYEDVPEDAWYAGIIEGALSKGILSKDITARPDDTISRQEMCKVLTEAIRAVNVVLTNEKPTENYTDAYLVDDWAKPYIEYVTKYGIMNGKTDGAFAPLSFATRAEAATVISRVLELIGL